MSSASLHSARFRVTPRSIAATGHVIPTATDERDTNHHALRAGADAHVAKRDDYLARLPQTLLAAVQRLPGTELHPVRTDDLTSPANLLG